MQSRMHPKYYISEDIFNREQEKIFKKLWSFAGFKNQVSKHNDFITLKIANIPIVIQNFEGELHAFENICLHRSAPLQSDPYGNRPLVCPYHAWKYDANGYVSHIPHCDSIYKIDKNNLRLDKFKIQTVGNILFVNLSPNPLPFENQFDYNLISMLESSSNSYDLEIMSTTWHCKFNWKLAYENLRDFNHVAYVHPRTLAPFQKFSFFADDSLAKETLESLKINSSVDLQLELKRFSYGGPEGQPSELKKFGWHEFVNRWKYSEFIHHSLLSKPKEEINIKTHDHFDDAYFNWLLYPNLHIASGNGGYSFVIEHHVPIAADKTDVKLYRFTAKKKKNYAASTQVLMSEMRHSKLILSEDFSILEKIQSNLHWHAPLPTQGAYEHTNRFIERWYTCLMETNNEL